MSHHHYLQLICELHRYPSLDHKTDAITLHGLDEQDRLMILTRFGSMARSTQNSVCITHTEHLNVINALSSERGYTIAYEPKLSSIPSKPGMLDHRYIMVYPMVKTVPKSV